MNCTRYRQLISRYVDDEVTPRQRRELLAHVEVCRDCAAWLARARQTDVLLKSVGDTHPSDSVRNAIIAQLRNDDKHAGAISQLPSATTDPAFGRQQSVHIHRSAFRVLLSSLLLRFDPSPRRIALGLLAFACASFGLLFWLNVLPQFWSNKLGFEVQPDSAGIASTPIPIQAISSNTGTGTANAPSLVLAQPGDGSQISLLNSPVVMRFDMPMDRGSVEDAFLITPPAAGSLSWDADNQLRWTPTAPGLLRGVTYTVNLSGTALSLAGTPLRGMCSWSFRTSDPYSVSPSPADGSYIGPAASLSLTFDTAMRVDGAQGAVSLREADTHKDIPASYSWDSEGKRLTLTPLHPLAAGYVSVVVDATAPTASGDTLGRSYEFKYRADLPTPRVHILDGRLSVASSDGLARLAYEAVSGASPDEALDNVVFDVYAFPAEKLSALGAQASAWPQALPAGFPSGLDLASTSHSQPVGASISGDAFLPPLSPGIYLVVAHGVLASGEASTAAGLTDWQLLIVGDSKLLSAGGDMPMWALTGAGHSWGGAEISLYSPAGELLEKGITGDNGLYSPSPAARGASLAVARDPSGHIASLVLNSGFDPNGGDTADTLPANLITDRRAYHPGEIVNFHAMLEAATLGPASATRLDEPTDGSANAQLLTPQGYVVSNLNLKPDSVGGISGVFTLDPTTLPGTYTIRVRWGNALHDFPILVLSTDLDTLSVAVLPSGEEEGATITRTVSVLGPMGRPQAGAVVTGTLGILGDAWSSNLVIATTNGDGLATFVMPLPDWFARFNEPGLFFRAEASSGDLAGVDTQYLDFTSQRMAAAGQTQAVDPLQNVAVVARLVPAQPPDSEAQFSVRAVLLDPTAQSGDLLLSAQSPTGERLSYSIDLASKPDGDATFPLPLRFAGGIVTIFSFQATSPRTFRLIPAGDGSADLRVLSPVTATASSNIDVRLNLSDRDGASLAGSATLVWRRVSGAPSDLPVGWQPTVAITASGVVTLTIQAPTSPGLWYLMSEATSAAGEGWGWAAVRVVPDAWMQLPPSIQSEAGEGSSFAVRVFNPGDEPLTADVEALNNASVVDADVSKSVQVQANGLADEQWRLSATRSGDTILTFSLAAQDLGFQTTGEWPLSVSSKPHQDSDVTYTSGSLTGERNVGVAVPWGLDSSDLTLEIRASTSLLSSLAGITRDLYGGWVASSDGVSMAAARLSAGAPVASAFARSGEGVPDDLLLSGVERSRLLQQLYAAQHQDGSWGGTLDGDGVGSVSQTAAVLLAFYRSSYYPYGDGQLQPDQGVIERALQYLSSELARPLRVGASSNALDERAYALYAFSLYRSVPNDWMRPLLAYALPGPSGAPASLTVDGQAYLALALMQSDRMADALALLDTALRLQSAGSVPVSAPMLMALLQSEADASSGANSQPFSSSYSAIHNSQSGIRNSLYVTALMEAREGAGWHTPLMTADAMWALSLYAAMEGEHPRSDSPALFLGDRPIQPNLSGGIPGELSVLLPGDELKAGTNWLKLRSPASGEPLYYSLTLIATR